MTALIDALLIFLILGSLMLLASDRLSACIRIVAFQGIALGLLPLVLPHEETLARLLVLVVVSIALKGILFPLLLFRALRAAAARREVEPFVGYSISTLMGVGLLAISLWLGARLKTPAVAVTSLLVPTAMFTVLIGLFLIVSRKKALTQVLGYLVMENGIYLFGITLSRGQPLLVEMGVLLDVFVAVFVMGITIFHISREFDHIDVDQLSALKD